MVCPHCGTSMTAGSSCPGCGRTDPAPAADQFGSPMPSGLTGYTPPPTSAQLYPEQPPPVPADPAPWAAQPPPGAPWPGQPQNQPWPGQPQNQAWSGQPQGGPYGGPWGPPVQQQAGNGFSIAGIVLGVIALVFCPLLFGAVGVVMAVQGRKRGESLSKVALGVSIGGLVGGILLTVILMATTSLYNVNFS